MLQTAELDRLKKGFCTLVLGVDPSMRFVGRLCNCGRLKSYDRKKGVIAMLNLPETKLVHHEAILKAKMNHMFDSKLGETHWTITQREKVKWITIYLKRELLLISTEPKANHDEIIRKIMFLINRLGIKED